MIGIGSPRASLESNFALRSLVGEDRFYSGIPPPNHDAEADIWTILRNGPAHTPSLHEVESADAVFILGEDVTNVAPRMALSLRQSVRQQPMQIAERLHIPLWMDHGVREAIAGRKRAPVHRQHRRHAPGRHRHAHISRARPTTRRGLASQWQMPWIHVHPRRQTSPEQTLALAAEIAQALKTAKTPSRHLRPECRSAAVIQAAANVAWALPAPHSRSLRRSAIALASH